MWPIQSESSPHQERSAAMLTSRFPLNCMLWNVLNSVNSCITHMHRHALHIGSVSVRVCVCVCVCVWFFTVGQSCSPSFTSSLFFFSLSAGLAHLRGTCGQRLTGSYSVCVCVCVFMCVCACKFVRVHHSVSPPRPPFHLHCSKHSIS